MDMNNLQTILHNFIKDTDSKSILVDGPWGCGKTYETKEFIKNNKKLKIYYLSLFGLETIDEINTAFYAQTKKGQKRFIHGTLLISKVIKAFPIIPNISEALEYQLGSNNNVTIKKKSIIVLDDLERLSTSINYIDLMGYINSLYLSGCRFICLMSSQKLSEDRKKDFNEFKEKVFDSVYKISSFDKSIVESMFRDLKIANIFETYDLFENNLRLVQKTKCFYTKVKHRIDENEMKHIDFNELSILKACAIVINICLKSYDYSPKEDDVFYDEYCNEYGEELAKNIYHFKHNDEYRKIPKFLEIVESLISAFLYQNFNLFDDKFFIPEIGKEVSILDNEFYYLSDNHKNEYINEFLRLISTNLKWNNRNTEMLRSILIYSDYIFDDDKIKSITILMKDNVDFHVGVRWALGLESENNIEKNEYFIKKMAAFLRDFKKTDLIHEFDKCLKEQNYYNMTNMIEEIGVCVSDEKKDFLNYLVENNFFIPDISGDINHNLWSYCHSIARFASNNGKKENFKLALKNMHSGIKTKSELDRCRALIFYNIDNNVNIDDLK